MFAREDFPELAGSLAKVAIASLGWPVATAGATLAEFAKQLQRRLTSLAQVHTAADFTGSDQQRHAYVGTKSCGPVTWAYFGMLLGRPDAKPDRWLLRFAGEAIGEPQSPEEVRVLVNAAAAHYEADTSRLDHAIWRHASGRS